MATSPSPRTPRSSPGIYGNITIQSGSDWGGGGGGGGWGGGGGGGGSGCANPVVTLSPGIYYLQNGGSLTLSAGTLQGTGVMIFDNTGGDNVFNTSSGPVNISPPNTDKRRIMADRHNVIDL